MAIAICERIATTPKPLAVLCATTPGLPGIATITRWLRIHPDFHAIYLIAKQAQVDLLLEEAIAIADDSSQDHIVTKTGRILFNPDAIRRAKLQIKLLQQRATKLLPRQRQRDPSPSRPSKTPPLNDHNSPIRNLSSEPVPSPENQEPRTKNFSNHPSSMIIIPHNLRKSTKAPSKRTRSPFRKP
jgi:hypothetical protein